MDLVNDIDFFCNFRNVAQSNDEIDDESHIFLKRVCNILTLLGQAQLATLWVNFKFNYLWSPTDTFILETHWEL